MTTPKEAAPAPIKAGSLVGYDPENPKLVALVVETSSNDYDDDTSEHFALIVKLPTEMVSADTLFAYGDSGKTPERAVTGSKSDTATAIGG